ncbi:ribosomal protein S18-alanine N-acetyltransferase [Nonomuraea wenchangensis]
MVTLRPMTAADLPAVMAIERATFPLDAWSEGMMRGELDDMPRTRHYVVALDDDEIVAYAGLAAAADQADVQTIAVLDKHQGRGIGSALLTELLAEARRRGAREIFLEVRADNPRAQAVYRRFEFEEIGTRRRYYDDGTDAIMMRRKLDG